MRSSSATVIGAHPKFLAFRLLCALLLLLLQSVRRLGAVKRWHTSPLPKRTNTIGRFLSSEGEIERVRLGGPFPFFSHRPSPQTEFPCRRHGWMMGTRFAKHCQSTSSQRRSSRGAMADAPEPAQCCCTQPSSSKTVCPLCSGGEVQVAEAAPAAVGPRRAFRNLSLGCRKSHKAPSKQDKQKTSWTLRWKLKAPPSTTNQTPPPAPLIDLTRFNPNDYPIEDKDEVARRQRAREIAEGIEMEVEALPVRYRVRPEFSGSSLGTDNSLEASSAILEGKLFFMCFFFNTNLTYFLGIFLFMLILA